MEDLENQKKESDDLVKCEVEIAFILEKYQCTLVSDQITRDGIIIRTLISATKKIKQ